ncbi:YqeG family HAD IIIA-type phosphatase [Candidatus Margulisiibacteriota bacterium]
MSIMQKAAQMITPKERFGSIYDVSLSYLLKKGIKGIILDVDNTLLSPEAKSPSLKCRQWLEALKDQGLKACLVSNERDPKRLTMLAEVFNVPAVHSALKPFPWAMENAIQELLGLSPQEVAVIGDTIISDVIPGNLLKAHTILVDPIAEQEDHVFHWLTRRTGDALARVITRTAK